MRGWAGSPYSKWCENRQLTRGCRDGVSKQIPIMGNSMRQIFGALLVFAALPVVSGNAADMPLKAPPVAAAVYNWTGFYLGGEIGGGWSTSTTTNLDGNGGFPAGFVNGPVNSSGVLGGAYAGANYQFNNIVVGIDGYYDAADLTGSATDISPGPGPGTGNISGKNEKMKWDSAITARLGLASSNWLFYAKGGWAWARFSSIGVTTTAGGGPVGSGSASDTRNGGTVGVGVEYGFTPHWAGRLEYDYVKFQTASFNSINVSAITGAVSTHAKTASSDLNELKAGLAYRF
jgi:outer membrane immunogenic protein